MTKEIPTLDIQVTSLNGFKNGKKPQLDFDRIDLLSADWLRFQ